MIVTRSEGILINNYNIKKSVPTNYEYIGRDAGLRTRSSYAIIMLNKLY